MNNPRGQTLVAMYMLVLMLSVLGGSFLTRGFAVNQHSQIQKQDAEAFYLAQGGIEDAVGTFTTAIAGYQIDANTPCYPDTDSNGSCSTTISDADIAAQTDLMVTSFCSQPSASCPNSPFAAGTNPRAYSRVITTEADERLFTEVDGTTVRLRNYEIITRAVHPSNSSLSVTLHQVVTRRIIFTFQHAVFYNDDLEVLPGANMTLSGRVHSNADMYLDAYSGKTLTVDTDYVRAVGDLYNFRKNDGSSDAGSVQIKEYGSSPSTYEYLTPGNDSTNGNWVNIADSNWGGTVKTSAHSVTALAVPAVASTAPSGANAFYANTAKVKVVNGIIYKKNAGGTYDVVAECAPATVNADNQDSCVPPGTLTTNTTGTTDANRFVNQREGSNKIIKMTNLDMMRLGGYYDGNSDGVLDAPGSAGNPYISNLPDNGLLYATRDDAAVTEQPGIRLQNGSLINRAGGLTVVSNDPVYIQGNFNTTAKKPVAVIGDALHLLSSSWQDSNSYLGIGSRVAATTTFNSAFIAGIKATPDGGGTYSGGLENYPRLQEDWAGKTLNITGSFVELWQSQIATGNWPGTGSIYKAPVRNWSYDVSFESGALPPFTPFAIEAIRGVWWRE